MEQTMDICQFEINSESFNLNYNETKCSKLLMILTHYWKEMTTTAAKNCPCVNVLSISLNSMLMYSTPLYLHVNH